MNLPLPNELILDIISYMSLHDISKTCKTNKKIYKLCKDNKEYISKIILKNEFGFDFSDTSYCYNLLKLLMYIDYLNVLRITDKRSDTRFIKLERRVNRISLKRARKRLLKYQFAEYTEEGDLENVKILTPLSSIYFPEFLELGLLKAVQENQTSIIKYLISFNVVPGELVSEYITRKGYKINPEIKRLLGF